MSSPGAEALVHLASARGTAGIALLEVYGPESAAIVTRSIQFVGGEVPGPGRARLGRLLDVRGEPVDDVVVSRVEAGDSWCGLPGWSLSCHGGPAVVRQALEILRRGGCRCVETEELLDRALVLGGLDLLARTAHSLLREARTERAALYFNDLARGSLRERCQALLDSTGAGEPDRARLVEEIRGWVRDAGAARRLAQPLRILLGGRPNAGKSTLFNALLGEERVVVSPLGGTTRDVIEELIEIDGYPVCLIDGAGWREGSRADAIEAEGITRTREVERDVELWLRAPGDPIPFPPGTLVVHSKTDLEPAPPGALGICARTGSGLRELRDAIRSRHLGPGRDQPLPPLPPTPAWTERFSRLADRLESCEVDAVPDAFLECLGSTGGHELSESPPLSPERLDDPPRA